MISNHSNIYLFFYFPFFVCNYLFFAVILLKILKVKFCAIINYFYSPPTPHLNNKNKLQTLYSNQLFYSKNILSLNHFKRKINGVILSCPENLKKSDEKNKNVKLENNSSVEIVQYTSVHRTCSSCMYDPQSESIDGSPCRTVQNRACRVE
jgi:hypothetical protein